MWLPALAAFWLADGERRLLSVHLRAEDFEHIPLEPRFWSLKEAQEGCRSSGFSSISLEDMRFLIEDFYRSGTALLSNYHLVERILEQKQQVAAVCPQAVLLALLLQSERRLVEAKRST